MPKIIRNAALLLLTEVSISYLLLSAKVGLVFLLLFAFLPAYAACERHTGKLQKVKVVFDGDTVMLSNGVKVRLLGLNTPEIAHGDHEQDMPYGKQAKNKLQQLIKSNDNMVFVLVGTKKRDHYGRQLAWLFDKDGSLLAEKLISVGLAYHVAMEDVRFASCLAKAENAAQTRRLGIWSLPLQSVERNINPGFGVFTGKAVHFGESKYSFWVNMQGDLVLKFNKNRWQSDKQFVHGLVGKRLQVQGWVFKRKSKKVNKKFKNYILTVTHKSMLSIN